MKYIDESRDRRIVLALAKGIARRATRSWVPMEVCGGQTHTLMRYGIDELMPSGVSSSTGPGCPVCATPLEMIDKAIAIASRPGSILASYGDMLCVPSPKCEAI
jgi:hydrogenase expression/formation protein HypD